MPKVLILTDGAAQFTSSTFPGFEKVHVLPWRSQATRQTLDAAPLNLTTLPVSLLQGPLPVLPPSEQDFLQTLTTLGQQAHEIILLLSSSYLNPAVQTAQAVLQTLHCPASVFLVDTQNIGAGQGLLVQAAAQAAAQGSSGVDIYRYLRKLVPHTYSLFCVQSLTYLAHAGHLELSQAIVGEMLNLLPFFMLESGRLTPIQKVRSSRQLFEVIGEFIGEFDDLLHIALAYGVTPFDQEGRLLVDRLGSLGFAEKISAQSLNGSVAAVFGPRCLGVSVIEKIEF
jgi:DegV family protein with EDD domain